jgi:kinesin family protein C1
LQNEVVLLETQIAAHKQRGFTLQGEAEGLAADKASLKEELVTLRKLVLQRDEELREAEMIRRKLHNQVQELKG